ncbi:hypothetical protein GDO81_024901 [Engystomops pustulosus]|uniref:Uncharacterized protein n=1 Tax=Engystomops pustulosus TaxID=76066 RepID=A0AAV6Z2R5_ENGPU|nr:hypothetical protein GDO81_024901 [Engystomops pustulosus]
MTIAGLAAVVFSVLVCTVRRVMVGSSQLENANPLIYQRSGERQVTAQDEDEELHDKIDDREIFDLIRSINDPEHPLSLEELNVVEEIRVKSISSWQTRSALRPLWRIPTYWKS